MKTHFYDKGDTPMSTNINDLFIFKLNNKVRLIEKGLNEEIDATQYVYHYTSFKGLDGILRDGKNNPVFWFSRYDVLNDITEGCEIYDVFHAVVEELKSTNQIDSVFAELLDKVKKRDLYLFTEKKDNFMNPIDREIIPNTEYHSLPGVPYICCFSKDEDSLPMWNYYCKNGLYDAYNIGVKADRLINDSNSFGRGYIIKLFRVIYDKEKKKALIRGLLLDAYSVYKDKSSLHKGWQSYLINCITDFLNKYRFAFKKDCFKHENEYRAVLITPKKNIGESSELSVRFRDGYGMIIPYIEHEWKECNVYSVNLGPCEKSQKKYKKRILNDYLKSRNWLVEVGCSNIPVRY